MLDENPVFSFKSELFEPVVNRVETPLLEGSVIEVETVEMLKMYVGERLPPQKLDKKDVKKK